VVGRGEMGVVVKTSWFTFGQAHAHSVAGVTYDKDCVVKITADSPRDVMVRTFGQKWCWEYDEEPDMRWYPRGVFQL
jgi:hypothetical protein